MKIRNILLLTLVVAVILSAGMRPASAQQRPGLLLKVNSSGDTHDAEAGDGVCADAGGHCTLRAAIEQANSNAVNNVIYFSVPRPAVIDLTLGELRVIGSLQIVGPGARRLTVRRSPAAGTADFRIFYVPAGGAFLTIRGMTISNGKETTGGGIFVEQSSTVWLLDSALIGNRATSGGGAAATGQLFVLRCLVASNTADDQGGGIVSTGSVPVVRVIGSTFTGNSASIGGAISNDGNLSLVNNTISGNAASLASSSIMSGQLGTVKVINTIIGRDVGQTVPALQGAFQSGGNNIVTNLGPGTGFTNGVNGDQVSQNNQIDPLLGALADNGGQTNTFALLPGSTAVNNGNVCVAGSDACPLVADVSMYGASSDQRRLRRRLLTTEQIDIGSFESDGLAFPGGTSGSGVLWSYGPGSRFANSVVEITNANTLEKYYTFVRIAGFYRFYDLPAADVYLLEIRAKRSGISGPSVIAID